MAPPATEGDRRRATAARQGVAEQARTLLRQKVPVQPTAHPGVPGALAGGGFVVSGACMKHRGAGTPVLGFDNKTPPTPSKRSDDHGQEGMLFAFYGMGFFGDSEKFRALEIRDLTK